MKARKRNQFASLLAVTVLIALVLCLAGGAPGTGAPSVHSQLINTPAAPGGDEPQGMPDERVTDEMTAWGDDTYAQHAQALRQGGVRVPMADRKGVVTSVSADGIVCADMLLNPKMDVVDLGGGNWSADPWVVWWPEIYPDNVEYHSASYSLAMKDDPAVDTATISPTLDFDGIVQMFMAPSGLMTVTVSYSRLYNSGVNSGDVAAYALYTVTNESLLGERVAEWGIGESSPTSWSNRYAQLTPSADATELAKLSGEWVALRFELWSDRTTPYEFVWVDDVQVSMCYRAEQVYLPLAQWTGVVPDVCMPLEPDSATHRGSTFVGATCDGCFSPLDTGDYYTLYLDGTTEVKVCLRNLPPGSNWDALIYWDKGEGATPRYELACQIGTPGDQNKCSDPCTLNPANDYFVMVNTGTAPPNTQCYDLSVEATGVTPSGPTPGFWESTTDDEFYVTPDRAYVDNFAIYINVYGCGYYKITHNPPEPISSNQFSFTGSFYANGTFSDSTHCSGQDGLNNFYIAGCGYVNGGPWSWNAVWKNSSQPTFRSAEVIEPETVEPVTGIDDFYTVTLVK